MKLVTTKFKSGGLHEKHVVATWSVATTCFSCSPPDLNLVVIHDTRQHIQQCDLPDGRSLIIRNFSRDYVATDYGSYTLSPSGLQQWPFSPDSPINPHVELRFEIEGKFASMFLNTKIEVLLSLNCTGVLISP